MILACVHCSALRMNSSLAVTLQFALQSFAKSKEMLMHGVEVDIHELVEEDELIAEIHRNAEVSHNQQIFQVLCFKWMQA